MNYSVGAHSCKPHGDVKYSEYTYNNKHMAYMGLPFLINKMTKRYERSELMRSKGMGTHYTNDVIKITTNYNSQFQNFEVKNEVFSKENLPKITLEFNMKINFIKYYYQVVIFENQGVFYEVYFWTLNDFVTKNKKEIDLGVKSISVNL
jgi:hypothetical protein